MVFFLVMSLLLLPGLASAQSPGARAVAAQIVAESASVRPGTPFVVAVYFRIDPGWHIYWKNPGDTGLPTSVSWDLPKGFTASDLLYPVPQRFVQQGLSSYGYEREVALLSRITPAADLEPGKVTIRAHASWLACRIECTPGKADLAMTLSVRSQAPIDDERWAALLRTAISRVPEPASGTSASLQSINGRMVLHVTGLSLASGSTAYFVPSDPGILAEGAQQDARIGSASVTIDLRPAKGTHARRLNGVLVVQDQAALVVSLWMRRQPTRATRASAVFSWPLCLLSWAGSS